MSTEKRKQEHIEKALSTASQYKKTTLFEKIHFIHNSLPEIDFEDVDLSSYLFGKKFSLPLMITGMTGGYKKAKDINKKLAIAAEKFNIPFGLGSQRAMIEKPKLKETYAVKKYANVFLIGNIGAYQLKSYTLEQIDSIVKDVDADALAIHLNPLQEVVQKEGDINWEGVLDRIKEIVESIDVPVIIKETGAGISREVAFKLSKIGVSMIDISGAGGTSWSKVEYMRGGRVEGFEEWGIPTALSLVMCKDLIDLVASGGIRNSIDGAKAIALGAEFYGAAKPFLDAYYKNSIDKEIAKWKEQLRTVLFLTGSSNVEEFKRKRPIYLEPSFIQLINEMGLRL